MAGLARDIDWRVALGDLLEQLELDGAGQGVDLAFLFASHAFTEAFEDIVRAVGEALAARHLIGCSGQGVIALDRELEGQPALSLLAFSLPEARLQPLRLTQEYLDQRLQAEEWRLLAGVGPEDVSAWFVFADPFTFDAEALLGAFELAYPRIPLVGGLASGDFEARRTHLFLNDQVFDSGAVALGLGGPYRVETVVSQGCQPIGQTWTITSAEGHAIHTIASRPALQVLRETIGQLPPEQQRRVQGNLLVGLAMEEERHQFGRGDFLIRNLLGADPRSGAIVVGARPRLGQTIQFQLRDPEAADDDLLELLQQARQRLGDRAPVGALLCSCNGRGAGLFGGPHHDARAVAEALQTPPLAGFFCNGEIGPVGGKNFLHGFTASLALILPSD